MTRHAGAPELSLLLVTTDDAVAAALAALASAHGDLGIGRATGLDALAVLRRGPAPDCVVIDLECPQGADVLASLTSADGPAVITVARTAGSGIGLVGRGAQDHLVLDGLTPDGVLRAVRFAVARHRGDRAARDLFRAEVRAKEWARLEQSLVPVPLVGDPGVRVEVAYRAGRDGVLGGDFYDVVERADGALAAVLGDVSGHGPDEAALGATLRIAWRTATLAGLPPATVLDLVEQILVAERGRPEIFATLTQVVIDPVRASLELFLCGHPAPLLLGAGPLPPVPLPDDVAGRALGIPLVGGWRGRQVALPAHWQLLMTTDGVLEATVGPEDRLGMTGLRGILEELAVPPEGRLVDAVLAEVTRRHGGPLVDDAALVHIVAAAPV